MSEAKTERPERLVDGFYALVELLHMVSTIAMVATGLYWGFRTPLTAWLAVTSGSLAFGEWLLRFALDREMKPLRTFGAAVGIALILAGLMFLGIIKP